MRKNHHQSNINEYLKMGPAQNDEYIGGFLFSVKRVYFKSGNKFFFFKYGQYK